MNSLRAATAPGDNGADHNLIAGVMNQLQPEPVYLRTRELDSVKLRQTVS